MLPHYCLLAGPQRFRRSVCCCFYIGLLCQTAQHVTLAWLVMGLVMDVGTHLFCWAHLLACGTQSLRNLHNACIHILCNFAVLLHDKVLIGSLIDSPIMVLKTWESCA